MTVTIICNSDTTGGAAVVTRRLMNALRHEGVNVNMLVCSKLTDNPDVHVIGSSTSRSAKFMSERIGIFARNGMSRADLFKVSTASAGHRLDNHPLVRGADIILLSWINQGVLSLRSIARLGRLGKPIVWMMHDMWNLTGICHHAYSCTHYEKECGCCPLLHSTRPHDLSHTTWARKMRLYDTVPIHFVAVSHWLADCCQRSSLLKGRDVTVIPNPFPINQFFTEPQTAVHLPMLDYSRKIILMGAARLDDPIKGLDYAIDALNIIFAEHPEVTRDCTAVFFGSLRDTAALDRLNFPHIHLGTVSDPKVISELYAASKVVLSTSLYETLPGTLIEGQAGGAIPVTFGEGGQSDIVDHKRSGFIARYLDPTSVAEGILWALEADIPRQQLHDQVAKRFASSAVAARYIDLFNRLLKGQEAL